MDELIVMVLISMIAMRRWTYRFVRSIAKKMGVLELLLGVD